MTTNTSTHDYTDVTRLSREADKLCDAKYGETWQWHFRAEWHKRISRAEQLYPTNQAVAELTRLIELLRS